VPSTKRCGQALGREMTSGRFPADPATVTGPATAGWTCSLFRSQLFEPVGSAEPARDRAPFVDAYPLLFLARGSSPSEALLSEAASWPSRVVGDSNYIIEPKPYLRSRVLARVTQQLSVLSLQDGFRRHVGWSDMAYVGSTACAGHRELLSRTLPAPRSLPSLQLGFQQPRPVSRCVTHPAIKRRPRQRLRRSPFGRSSGS